MKSNAAKLFRQASRGMHALLVRIVWSIELRRKQGRRNEAIGEITDTTGIAEVHGATIHDCSAYGLRRSSASGGQYAFLHRRPCMGLAFSAIRRFWRGVVLGDRATNL